MTALLEDAPGGVGVQFRSFVPSASAGSADFTEIAVPSGTDDPDLRRTAPSSAGTRAWADFSWSRQSAASERRGLIDRIAASTVLVAGDVAAFLAAWLVLFPLGISDSLTEWAPAAAAGAAISVFWLAGLYPGYRLHDHERFRRRAHAVLGLAVAGGLAAAVLSDDGSKFTIAGVLLAVAFGFQLIFEGLAKAVLHRLGLWGESAAIIGGPQEVAQLRSFFRRHWRYGIRPASGQPARIAIVVGTVSSADVTHLRQDFAEVVLLGNVPGLNFPAPIPAGRPGEIGLTLFGRRGATLAPLDRIVDLAVALPAAVIFTPVMVVAAIVIRIVDPGPVLYRQMREGLNGSPFPVLKLRTMYLDAEERLERLLQTDAGARSEWEAHFKLRDDPRVLPVVGKILRACSIDEMPQLFNVIAGKMSIVGPRPFPIYHLAAMNAEFRGRRSRMKPGLTGLWQISERSCADIALQQQIDDFYMENRSFWFDLHIILSTIFAVLRGRGAY